MNGLRLRIFAWLDHLITKLQDASGRSRAHDHLPVSESQRIDPERLAALIDGRLSESEAAVLRRQLAASDDATLAAFADAVVVSRELDPASGVQPSDVIPIRAGQSARRWTILSTAAAAVIVAAIVLRFRTGDVYEPRQFARALPPTVSTTEGSVWGETRGLRTELSDRVLSARIGALLTDL